LKENRILIVLNKPCEKWNKKFFSFLKGDEFHSFYGESSLLEPA
jgi:hypothetical protein